MNSIVINKDNKDWGKSTKFEEIEKMISSNDISLTSTEINEILGGEVSGEQNDGPDKK